MEKKQQCIDDFALSWRENCVVGSLKPVFCLNFVQAEVWKFRSI